MFGRWTPYSFFIRTLQSLNLPAALDALDRPIGLPPSLLGKAEEVRLEDGMHRVPALIEDVQRLAGRNSATLDEVRFQLLSLIFSLLNFVAHMSLGSRYFRPRGNGG